MARKAKGKGKGRRRRSSPKKAAPRRRRGSTTVKLSQAGLKKVAKIENVLYVLIGIFGARAVYGLLSNMMPDLDQKIRAGVSGGVPLIASIIASGKIKVVTPVAMGALGSVAADMLAPVIAGMVPPDKPEIIQAINGGVGQEVAYQPVYLPPAEEEVISDFFMNRRGYPNNYGTRASGFGDIHYISEY